MNINGEHGDILSWGRWEQDILVSIRALGMFFSMIHKKNSNLGRAMRVMPHEVLQALPGFGYFFVPLLNERGPPALERIAKKSK